MRRVNHPNLHDDVIKWKHLCVTGPLSPVDAPHKGQWRGALTFLFASEQTVEQIIETPVIWDAITVMNFLHPKGITQP